MGPTLCLTWETYTTIHSIGRIIQNYHKQDFQHHVNYSNQYWKYCNYVGKPYALQLSLQHYALPQHGKHVIIQMPIICMVERRKQQTLPVLSVDSFMYTETHFRQWLQRTQKEKNIQYKHPKGNRRNVLESNLRNLIKQQKQSSTDSSLPSFHCYFLFKEMWRLFRIPVFWSISKPYKFWKSWKK